MAGGFRLPAELIVLDGQSLDVGDGDVQMRSQITVLAAEPVGGLSKFVVMRTAAGVIGGCGGAHLVDHVGGSAFAGWCSASRGDGPGR